MGARTWYAACAASAVLHVLPAAVFLIALQPGPISPAPAPETRFRVETHDLREDRAAAQVPEGERRDGVAPGGTELSGQAVPASRAEAADAMSETASAVEAGGPRLAPIAGPDPVTAAESWNGASLSAAVPEAVANAGVLPKGARVAATAADLQAAAPVVAAATRLPARAPLPVTLAAAPAAIVQATRPASGAAEVQLAAARPGTGPAVGPRDPGAMALPLTGNRDAVQGLRAPASGASLGGDMGTEIDPVSTGALQAFLVPDVAPSGPTARDGIAARLAREPCARLQAEFMPETGRLELRGHVRSEDRRGPVMADLAEFLGSSIPVDDNIKILPEPQCQALSGIAGLGLPQSTDQRTDPKLVGADAHARSYAYTRGQRLILEVAAPDYPAFVYVDFFDAEGWVTHIAPNELVEPLWLELGQSARIGAAETSGRFLDLVVGPPYGQEIAAAFAVSHALYDTPRPLREPAEPYLDWLTARIAEARAGVADFKGEWVYFHVETSE